MRKTALWGWLFALAALAAMVRGHMGEHGFDWKLNQISTYAARGPYGSWVTASMLLSAAAIACISVLVARHGLLGSNYLVYLVPVFAGAAVAGLVMLARYKETAMTMDALRRASLSDVRLQSFHDAGLLVFFYSTICLSALAGVCCALFRRGAGVRALGILVACLGPASFYLMTSGWSGFLTGTGVRQRAALFSLWMSMALLLALAMKKPVPGESRGVEHADTTYGHSNT